MTKMTSQEELKLRRLLKKALGLLEDANRNMRPDLSEKIREFLHMTQQYKTLT